MENLPGMIELDNIVFRYYENMKHNILDHVSLKINTGGITVIMGSSGCGKSTLAAVSCGLLPENGGFLESGEIRLAGKKLSELNQKERAVQMTMCFQNPDLQFCMDTLRKEMRFCMENLCIPAEEMDGKIENAARELQIEELLDQKLHNLSGGEKQKAALCCLYVMESRCFLLDEPFANIDEESAGKLIELLLRIRQLRELTIIVIDHKLKHWLDYADEIILLGKGADVLARNIRKDNLADHKELFLQEGIEYPEEISGKSLPRPQREIAVEVSHVWIPSKSRSRQKKWLLEDLNVQFPEGCVSALIGPSGCGKTTLFLTLLQQLRCQGSITFHGRELGKKELFRQVGIVFQNPANQFISQNVRQEVESSILRWNRGISQEACAKRVEEMLQEYDLQRYHRYSPYMLSQGQQRRLAVLSVLAGKQKILLLDEPTYGQDDRSAAAIMKQLETKIEQEGLTVILSTHDEELACQWADHIYRMKDGKIREETI